jgi:hypothetical protein
MAEAAPKKLITLKGVLAAGFLGLLIGTAVVLLRAPRTDVAANIGPIPDFAPDDHTSWFPDRPAGDDFLPPPSGPGPVLADKGHPYVPNGEGQPTYRVADLSNPILKPWAVAQMKKANDEVLAGGVPFMARERCWPAGVPAFEIFRRVAPVYFVQTPKEVLLIHRGDQQVRHVYMNVPHSAQPKPTWYGESVGHYENDELVVDTIGMNDKTFIDNYRTPHTEQLHVVERFKLVRQGQTLQVSITVDDPGAFNMPWQAVQRFRRYDEGPMVENICAENNFDFFTYKVEPIPQAGKPDF